MNTILIGLDLSFNSTGITISKIIDNKNTSIKFTKVVFAEKFKESIFKNNINTVFYTMPVNITVDDLKLNSEKNATEQLSTSIRALMCAKKIWLEISKYVNSGVDHNSRVDQIIVTIENYIMPSFGGQNSLQTVSGLIALQSYIREFFIKYKIKNENTILKIYTPTPTQNKKYFTGNGKADKYDMINSFIANWDGLSLIPNITECGKIDDIIDSFALMCHGWYEFTKR